MKPYIPKPREFNNPGRAFIDEYGLPKSFRDVVKYADFLRHKAKAGNWPPIKLEAIQWHFGIRVSRTELEQAGFVIESMGRIFINSESLETRQRFTEAHELMEFLYIACCEYPDSWLATTERKEAVCDQGAATLLMPEAAFKEHLLRYEISLKGASSLAKHYETSYVSTLRRIVDLADSDHLLILWKKSKKGSDFGSVIDWGVARHNDYLPRHIKVLANSVIAQAFAKSGIHQGSEVLDLGANTGTYRIEAKKVSINGKLRVISLISALS